MKRRSFLTIIGGLFGTAATANVLDKLPQVTPKTETKGEFGVSVAEQVEHLQAHENYILRDRFEDVIYNISPVETPFMANINKTKPSMHEWVTDELEPT